MKKIIFLIVLGITLFSCKTSSVTSTKLDRGAVVQLKGNWVLTTVSYAGSAYINVNSFQIADSKCFEGSSWKFISNNNSGSLSLNKPNCVAFSSSITWFINQEGQFVLKILNAGEKAKKVREGYVLRLANQTENSFQLVDNMDIGGQNKEIIYQFKKVN